MMAMLATRQEPGRLRQVELAIPALGEGDVLVGVAAASVNRVDLGMLDEWSGRSGDSAVPGCDAAGIIVGTCGIVGGLAVGDRVVTVARPGAAGSATYADLVSVPAAQVVRVPDGLELAIAAALPLAGLSAYQALYAIMPEAGDTLLIQGASGGVGTFAIQLACRGGARVIAGASVAAAPLCRALGAEMVVDSRRGDAAQLLRQHMPRGCNAVLSLMDNCDASTPAAFMGRHSRLVTLLSVFDSSAYATRLITAWRVEMRPDRRALEWLLSLVAKGSLRPVIAGFFPLAQAESAHALLRAGGVQGKLVLQASSRA